MIAISNKFYHFLLTITIGAILSLAWVNDSMAGTISFSFDLTGTQCFVTNRGDSTVYYPVVYQLDRTGQWLPRKSEPVPVELLPGGKLYLELAESAKNTDIDYIQAVMIRFFDQSGVSFGHLALLRPPPLSAYKLAAGYAGKRLKIKPPYDTKKIIATWVLAPYEEGIAPISGALTFSHHQPPATRIEWKEKSPAVIGTGARLPAAILVHVTPDGFCQQPVINGTINITEQRAAWLRIKKPFYVLAIICAVCGACLSVIAYRFNCRNKE